TCAYIRYFIEISPRELCIIKISSNIFKFLQFFIFRNRIYSFSSEFIIHDNTKGYQSLILNYPYLSFKFHYNPTSPLQGSWTSGDASAEVNWPQRPERPKGASH